MREPRVMWLELWDCLLIRLRDSYPVPATPNDILSAWPIIRCRRAVIERCKMKTNFPLRESLACFHRVHTRWSSNWGKLHRFTFSILAEVSGCLFWIQIPVETGFSLCAFPFCHHSMKQVCQRDGENESYDEFVDERRSMNPLSSIVSLATNSETSSLEYCVLRDIFRRCHLTPGIANEKEQRNFPLKHVCPELRSWARR